MLFPMCSDESLKFKILRLCYKFISCFYTISKIESPCVVKLASKDDEDEWHERVLDFINRLKNSGKIQDYNQLAFLFSSVKHERVISLARFLESNHINVYSPRSDMFFRREEVMQTLVIITHYTNILVGS